MTFFLILIKFLNNFYSIVDMLKWLEIYNAQILGNKRLKKITTEFINGEYISSSFEYVE